MEVCACAQAFRVAIWGDPPEAGRLGAIRSWPVVAVRVTPGDTPQFCAAFEHNVHECQVALVERGGAQLIDVNCTQHCQDRVASALPAQV